MSGGENEGLTSKLEAGWLEGSSVLEGVEILGPEMDSMRERFNIEMRLERINEAGEGVQDWQRSWSPSGPLQAGRNERGEELSSFWWYLFFVRISAGIYASRMGLGT